LFTGIGGIDLGLERAGMECRWQVEIDGYCNGVLERYWPDVRRYADVRTLIDPEPVDVIAGGFPCQDVSGVGLRAGISGERSGLWSEFLRLVRELRPRFVIVENVAGLLARGMGRVLGDLADVGYDAEWECIPASAFGAPHERYRVFIVAYPGSESGSARQLSVFTKDRCDSAQWWTNAEEWGIDRVIVEVGAKTPCGLLIDWRGFRVQPRIPRMVNGVPEALGAIRAYGNAVVPQVAEWIGRRIVASL
jgi:DNA (cytosine-5)-methyltransferase 1